jgi:hypothetical protein
MNVHQPGEILVLLVEGGKIQALTVFAVIAGVARDGLGEKHPCQHYRMGDKQ